MIRTSSAVFSTDRKYRYELSRDWWGYGKDAVLFIGLNPSTADEKNDDPTIRRCMGFAKRWGFEGMFMANLFAYRATNPKDMMACPKPIGRYNDRSIKSMANKSKLIVCAWGVLGNHLNRDKDVIALLSDKHRLMCLGKTKHGNPRHPLYVKADKAIEELL